MKERSNKLTGELKIQYSVIFVNNEIRKRHYAQQTTNIRKQ